jgi:hypothetical protein
MKALLSLLLCVALVHCALAHESVTNAPAKPDSMALVMFVIGSVIVGCVIIIKVRSLDPKTNAEAVLVLEKCHFDGYWVAIATNRVATAGTNWVDVFAAQMDDSTAEYRARLLR